ncbi:biliverdin-producing heme oxygenase [Mucilaginibacter terrae]|uniref:biliverdin-producing heme oxygenase n=1 Tax=Mucilaginibacter terrae TaxID=1955052 RepID=UPI0036284290
MLADQLKTETLTNHQQLEKLLVDRMRAIRSLQDYIGLLQIFYSYFGGLEEQIDQYITAAELPDYQQRRKSAALVKDIEDLGGTPVKKASGGSLPTIKNTLQAYAAMYVIEGSTLGGKIISKMMAQQLRITDDKGLSFFSGYGDNTGTMWEKFKQVLNLQSKSAYEESEIINTANQTFIKFKNWVDLLSV